MWLPRPGPKLALAALAGALLTSVAGCTPAGEPPAEPPALVLERGSVASRPVVALSRDLVIEGEARSTAVALSGNARVSGRVGEDLVVLDGDAELSETARIAGDLYVFGGSVRAAPGASVRGRVVAHPSARSSWIVLLEGPALGLPAFSRPVVGAKLAVLAAWLLVSVAVVATFARPLSGTADEVSDAPLRCFGIGLVAVLSMTLLVLLLASFAGAFVGLPLAIVVVLFALLLKLWGTVAVLLSFGEKVARRVRPRTAFAPRREPMTAILVALAVLGAVKLLPWAGVVVWTAMTLVGVGATLATKFGRQEGWFEG